MKQKLMMIRNHLRRHQMAIEILFLAVVTGAMAIITATYLSFWGGLAVAGYYAIGALMLLREPPIPVFGDDDEYPEPNITVPQVILGGIFSIPIMLATTIPFTWLLSVGWVLLARPAVEQIAAYINSPFFAAEIGLALGLWLMAYAIHIIFSWSVWRPVEPKSGWGKLLERIAGSHLLYLALVLLSARQLITPPMGLFFATIEIGYVYYVTIWWVSETMAGVAISRVQQWRAA